MTFERHLLDTAMFEAKQLEHRIENLQQVVERLRADNKRLSHDLNKVRSILNRDKATDLPPAGDMCEANTCCQPMGMVPHELRQQRDSDCCDKKDNGDCFRSDRD